MTSRGQNQSRQPDEARNVRPRADAGAGASSKSISHGGGKSRGVGGEGANPANAANAAMEVVWFPKAERYKRLGEPIPGGMGVVFKALDTNLDIEVAIKRIRPEFAANAELIKRFEREARTQVRLKHPNLVQVRDYAIDEVGPYIVMDWIEGQSLAQLVKDGLIEWKKAARIVGKCAMALHVAHEAGIIHRDIKPANILLNASGEPFVTDFGLVRIEAEHSATGETVTGALLGTVDFMAPEQLEDPRKASVQSDIWSLGATLYRITTGRSVRGMRESLIPEQVREIVIKAMEENPNERYRSMREFGMGLREAISRQTSTPEVSPTDGTSDDALKQSSRPENRPARVIIPDLVAESLSLARNFEEDRDAFRLVTKQAQWLKHQKHQMQVFLLQIILAVVALFAFVFGLFKPETDILSVVVIHIVPAGIVSILFWVVVGRMNRDIGGQSPLERIKSGKHRSLAAYRNASEWEKLDFVRIVAAELATPEVIDAEYRKRFRYVGMAICAILGGVSLHKIATGRIRAAFVNLSLSCCIPFVGVIATTVFAIIEQGIHAIRLSPKQYYEQVVIGDREWF